LPLFCATSVTGVFVGTVLPPPLLPLDPLLLLEPLLPLDPLLLLEPLLALDPLLPLEPLLVLDPLLPLEPLLLDPLLPLDPLELLEPLLLPVASVLASFPPLLLSAPASGTGNATMAQRWFDWLPHVHSRALAPLFGDPPLMSRHCLSNAAMSS
jgi:zinc finger protein PLAGL1